MTLLQSWQKERAVQAATHVGGLLLKWRSDNTMRVPLDAKKNKLTADAEAHAVLRSRLAPLLPEIPIVSEEDAVHQDQRPGAYWLIDPIDGTASWRDGFTGFVTQLAFIHAGTSQFGVVHAPALNKTYVGDLEAGRSTLNSVPLPVLTEADHVVLTDNTPAPHGIAERMMTGLPGTGYRESGSLGLKSCLITDGTADLFVKDVVVRDWDIAPVLPIVAGVHGILTLLDGEPYRLQGSYEKKRGLLVARDRSLWHKAKEIAATYRGQSPSNNRRASPQVC